mmetsp:Transcript_19700/g.48447  ORF Transcript_19700/g.48447 Transcript_19700/m.48447 type:complete len:117 (-) Transcript_19700:50-400(-)
MLYRHGASRCAHRVASKTAVVQCSTFHVLPEAKKCAWQQSRCRTKSKGELERTAFVSATGFDREKGEHVVRFAIVTGVSSDFYLDGNRGHFSIGNSVDPVPSPREIICILWQSASV